MKDTEYKGPDWERLWNMKRYALMKLGTCSSIAQASLRTPYKPDDLFSRIIEMIASQLLFRNLCQIIFLSHLYHEALDISHLMEME